MFSLIQKLRDLPLAFLDVETTGVSPEYGHRVIEVGIALVQGGAVVGEFEALIDPQRRISAGVSILTGISQDMVTGQPTFEQQLPRMLELMRGAIVVGHNVRFDLGFLAREFRIARQDMLAAIGDVPVLDTVRIARRRFGRGGNGLQNLSRRLGMPPPVAHRALADVRTTVGVFERMIEPLGGWDLQLADVLLAQGGTMELVPANQRESLLPFELEEALEQKRPVMMEYLDAQEARTQRMIRPMHLKKVGGELVLVAHCELRKAQRTFKVERIVTMTRVEHDGGEVDGAVMTGQAAASPPDENQFNPPNRPPDQMLPPAPSWVIPAGPMQMPQTPTTLSPILTPAPQTPTPETPTQRDRDDPVSLHSESH